MQTFTFSYHAAILAAFWVVSSSQAQTADSALPTDALQELANGGTKGLGADCSFVNLANCRLPSSRTPRPATATVQAARPPVTKPVNTVGTLATPLVMAAGAQGDYTGLRFGWQHENGLPAAKDHRFKTSDVVKLWVEVPEPGYVYVVNVDVRNVPTLLWPLGGDLASVAAGRATVRAQFVGNPGVERVYALFTRERLPRPEVYAIHAHKSMAPPSASDMNIQFAALDMAGRVSESGVAVSKEGRALTKGMIGLATNFEARQSSSVIAEPGGIALAERALVERFPIQVLSLDLIHVSR
ncbi:MAG: hypothetical protein ABIR26_08820 [Ramlibacter sp.]